MNLSRIFFKLLLIMILVLFSQCQEQQIDRQTQHIQQFARTMSDFVPTQTFTFTIGTGQQQNFILWPPAEIEKVRGVFYVDNSQDPQAAHGEGFFAGCQVNGIMKKTFVNQRLGVFNFKLQDRPSNLKFIFKSDTNPMKIYLSYEMKKVSQSTNPSDQDQNLPTKQEEEIVQKESKLKEVTVKFQKVRISVEGQQSSLRRVLKLISKHGRRLQNQINYAHIRITVETVIVILSGVLGIFIIKKQMSSGYELLV